MIPRALIVLLEPGPTDHHAHVGDHFHEPRAALRAPGTRMWADESLAEPAFSGVLRKGNRVHVTSDYE
eukprot:13095754-Alexandrium_andersonii.AAC.1